MATSRLRHFAAYIAKIDYDLQWRFATFWSGETVSTPCPYDSTSTTHPKNINV